MAAANRASSGRPRRRGRPRGPERAKTTIRLLQSLDDRLTEVCEGADVGLQDVIDAAVAYWMVEHGWLEADDVPAAAAAAMDELKQHAPNNQSAA